VFNREVLPTLHSDIKMVLITALSGAPVKVRHGDNQPMPLPWQAE